MLSETQKPARRRKNLFLHDKIFNRNANLFVYLVIVAVQGLVEDARVRPRTDDRVDDTFVTFTAEP